MQLTKKNKTKKRLKFEKAELFVAVIVKIQILISNSLKLYSKWSLKCSYQ